MKNRDIEKKLNKALRENTPNAWEKISREIADEPITVREVVLATGGGEQSRAVKRPAKWFTACVAALAILLCFLLFAPYFTKESENSLKVRGSVFIDINPSVQITVDDDGNADEILPLNEDARVLLAKTNAKALQGKPLAEAAVYVWELAYQTGYISTTQQDNALLLSSAFEDEAQGERYTASLRACLEETVKERGVYCVVLTEKRSAEAESKAEEYGITAGKYQLIQKAVEAGATVDEKEFTHISVRELHERITEAGRTHYDQTVDEEEYASKFDQKYEQAKQHIESFVKEEDYESKYDTWREEVGGDYESRWEELYEEWKNSFDGKHEGEFEEEPDHGNQKEDDASNGGQGGNDPNHGGQGGFPPEEH